MNKKIFSFLLITFFTVNLFAQKTKTTKERFPSSANFQVGTLPYPKAKAADFKIQKKITLIKQLTFVSCDVYFAGTGFPSVTVNNLKGPSLSQIQAQLDICMPGSSVSFANIKVKGPDGIRTIDEVSYILY